MPDPHFLTALLGIVWLDLILSGDNAVVIALVANGLPARQRNVAMVLGTGLAVLMRVVGALVAATLMVIPGLSLAAGLYLVWVAFSLVASHGDEAERAPQANLFKAILTIAVADFGMSLDNVVAVAGISHGDPWLMGLGIALSIPLMIAGAKLISGVIERFPLLVWAGAGLLAWVAGGVMLHDPLYGSWLAIYPDNRPTMDVVVPAVSAALALLAAGVFRATEREA